MTQPSSLLNRTGTGSPVPADAAGTAFQMPPGVVYLDCAAHGPRLRGVDAASRPDAGPDHMPWRPEWSNLQQSAEHARVLAARIFEADPEASGDGVAFIPSAAYGIAIAARNLPLARNESVLVLEGQFPSNVMPWQLRCSEVGARITVATRRIAPSWTESVLATLDAADDVRIVSLPNVHWHDGEPLDLDRIAEQVHARGAALVLDLSQSLGALPARLHRWQPQFVVAVGYKWLLGPVGLAYLWSAPHWREHGTSIEQHWIARDADHVWRFNPDDLPPYAPGARRFDAGGVIEPVRLAMAEAALEQIGAWSVPWIESQLRERTRIMLEALGEAGADFWRVPANAAHFVGVSPARDCDAGTIAAALRQEGVLLTLRAGGLRIAPHLHLDADALRAAASRIVAVARVRLK